MEEISAEENDAQEEALEAAETAEDNALMEEVIGHAPPKIEEASGEGVQMDLFDQL